MKINVAKHAGFCFGVKRSLNLVNSKFHQLQGPVKMYGQLVHNEEVVKELTEKGISVINAINQVNKGTLIITAHGISPGKKEKVEQTDNVDILDTTCPRVSYIHNVVAEMAKENRKILIFGDYHHQEVKVIKGVAPEQTHVFSSSKGLNKLDLDFEEKLGLVAQTTQDKERFRRIKREVKKHFSDISIYDTICNTTSWRQQEAKKMAFSHDAMVVIGSSNSANTNRLYQISKKVNPDTYFVSTYKDLKKSWFTGKEKIGITAGASTPDWVIQDVVETLEGIDIR